MLLMLTELRPLQRNRRVDLERTETHPSRLQPRVTRVTLLCDWYGEDELAEVDVTYEERHTCRVVLTVQVAGGQSHRVDLK